ncbi:uncharacterized protein L969DRAFT_92674 [Mixia osmundae IAM 14324]|uniref:Ubiquitin-like domain-containing protein n=1 Tax=Mixia osmundae (strain CBS 9802 / IAM 14324 / JCM 22182 / KY 12970) TaxID=764103 RepID=G7DY83_MIXOS|nr:uncharacterized protein L969DRAFT_92674 [Mixia osmundae IAM 14324]KEI41446.1 hypothetical protein L969DRAFT_92674 [Mixia osmundae IAM 14324]GAA95543.1 hypothetical protein E5Q_02198 [Mixia osmundae IAM 14324]
MSEQPETKPDGKISLTVTFPGTAQDGITFAVKPGTACSKLYKAVAAQRGVSENSFVLQIDGTRLNADHTVKMYELEDGDTIEFHVHQVGGSASN